MFAEYALLVFEVLQLAVAHMIRKQAVGAGEARGEERWENEHHHNTRLRAENVRISRFLSMGLPFRCFKQPEIQIEVP